MLQGLRQTLSLWTLAIVIASGPVCGASAEAGRLVSEQLLEHAKLRTVWHKAVPLKAGEHIASIHLIDENVYLLSDRNQMWSFDRVQGRMVFATSVAQLGVALLGLSGYGDSLVTIIDNSLVELAKATGQQQRTMRLGVSAICPLARNSTYIYVAAADRRLHALQAKDLVRAFQVAPENDSTITSVLADEGYVVFGTDAGNVVCVAPDRPVKLWQFDATAALVGPVVRDATSFYISSTDTYVYRLDPTDAGTVNLAWRFQTPGIPDRAPRVTDQAVYAYVPVQGLSAIDKQRGMGLWTLRDGLDLLAEARARAYVITKDKTLAVMDNQKGKLLYRVNLAAVTRHVANTVDSRIYIADNNGRIACLEPAE